MFVVETVLALERGVDTRWRGRCKEVVSELCLQSVDVVSALVVVITDTGQIDDEPSASHYRWEFQV